jgi:hypothetical protein
LDFEPAFEGGALDHLIHEATYLGTSDYNGYIYRLSAHSTMAEQVGISEDEIERAQRSESEDEQRVDTLRSVPSPTT